jgi:hypothetical protein
VQAEIGLAPAQVRGNGPHIDAFLRESGDGFLFGAARLEVRRQDRPRRRGGLGRVLRHGRFGPDSALIDPIRDQTDLGLGQRLSFVRHHIIVALRQVDAAHHLALAGVARDKGRAVLAALEGRVPRIQAQLTLLLFRAMAFDAVLLENGLNVLPEIHFGFGSGQEARAEGGTGHDHDQLFHKYSSVLPKLRGDPSRLTNRHARRFTRNPG